MCFNFSILLECRQIRKPEQKSGSGGKHRGSSSILSSGDDCYGASCFHKHNISMSAAAAMQAAGLQSGAAFPPGMYPGAAAMYGHHTSIMEQMQLVSRNHSKHSKHSIKNKNLNGKNELSMDEKRKFSQTGSSIFAQFDMRYREQMASMGRHPATQQSQSQEKMDDGSRNNSATKTVKPDKMGGPVNTSAGLGMGSMPNTSAGTAGALYPTITYMDPFRSHNEPTTYQIRQVTI